MSPADEPRRTISLLAVDDLDAVLADPGHHEVDRVGADVDGREHVRHAPTLSHRATRWRRSSAPDHDRWRLPGPPGCIRARGAV